MLSGQSDLAAAWPTHTGLDRELYGPPNSGRGANQPRPMPVGPRRRHEYWTVEIRYLDHGSGDVELSSISIIETVSLAVAASMPSTTQHLSPHLKVPDAAVRQQGASEGLESPQLPDAATSRIVPTRTARAGATKACSRRLRRAPCRS